jgi:signal transduction histidine kinase/DNA-binding response OmpR family regulator
MHDEKINILLVDDLPEKLMALELVLEELGQNVVCVRSGREALRRLLEQDFAVILLDVNMPDIDGFETAALIRQRKRSADTPIIFVTGFTDETHLVRGYSLGAVDYILSPVVPEILRTKVGVFVDLFKKNQLIKKQAEERVALAREQAARAAAEEATRRSAFLAEASRVLVKSLDYNTTRQSFLRQVLPYLGDFAALTETDDAGAWNSFVAVTAADAGGPHLSTCIGRESLGEPLAAAIAQALTTGTLEQFADVSGTENEDCLPFALRQGIVVPLLARGRTLGALTLGFGASPRSYGAADLATAEDVAGRAAIALDNCRLYQNIRESDRQKNEFLAMLAHELRNPLAPIRNAVQVLRMNGRHDEKLDWARDIIDRQVQQMVRMVDDLLDVSRITRGKIQLQKERIDVTAAVQRAVETSRPLLEAFRHELCVTLPPDPIYVEADLARLAQVLANLLNNAAKYTPEGGKVALAVSRDGDEAVFAVRDSGIGIPPEMLANIFDLFTQVDRSLDRSQGGLGIGLTLVRRLVELHGGTVRATSAGLQQGSEFTVRLPAVAGVPGLEASRNGAGTTARHGRCLRMLVVDDNADAADSLAICLRLTGHEIRVAYDGATALNLATEFVPEVVLLDIGLPEMDGYEIARRIRADERLGRPVLIAVTGYGQETDRARTREAGFDYHLVKPVDPEILTGLIARLLSPCTVTMA